MKKIVTLFLLITQIFFAQNGFEKGNALYKNLQYKEAVEAYESVVSNEKMQSGELYFNLGNCYYKMNKVAPSIYNYEKALLLNPNDSEVLNNLKFAKKRTIDEIKEVPKVGFAKLIRNATSIFDYTTWAIISVVIAFVSLLSFIGYYFSQLTFFKRLYFVGMFVLVFLLLLTVLITILEKNHFDNDRPAIVFSEMTKVHSEPNQKSSIVVVLHEGTKVYVKESLKNWKKIELTDGTEGWIDPIAIREVK